MFSRKKAPADAEAVAQQQGSGQLPDEKTTGVTSGVSIGDDVDDQAANLQKFQKMHKWDLFMDADQLDTVDNVLASGDIEKEAALEQSILEENSPYSEVRSSVGDSHEQEFPGSPQLTDLNTGSRYR